MTALQTLFKVRRCGVTLVPGEAGDRLRFHPASALPPELVEELRQHKESIIEILSCREERQHDRSLPIGNVGEFLQMARARFGPVEDHVTPPAPPGRDPLVKRGTDKGRFFKRDWRQTWPQDFEAHGPDGGGAA